MGSSVSVSDVKYPDFFKVYLPQYCSTNLKIPDAFLENIREKIPKKMVLKSRYGKLWVVEVGEVEDGLYIQEGWSRFVIDNSLEAGDFVVFKYNGHHVFNVIVFGASGCEKEQSDCSAQQKMADVNAEASTRKDDDGIKSGYGGPELVEKSDNRRRGSGKKQLGNRRTLR